MSQAVFDLMYLVVGLVNKAGLAAREAGSAARDAAPAAQ